jgi:hypothetical protein
MKKLVFIRDDDVCQLTPAFLAFFDYCFDNDIPVVYAVIPGRMQSSMVRFLRRRKKQKPLMVDIVQHGWRHTNYQRKNKAERGGKYEFGPLRSYAVQYRDMCRGRSKMLEAFEGDFTDAFVPPFHGYDKATLHAVAACGFKMFSARKNEFFPRKDVICLPVSLSLPAGHDFRGLLNILWRHLKSQDRIIGVLGHHEKLRSERLRREAFNFFSALKKLQKEGACRLTTFSGIGAEGL